MVELQQVKKIGEFKLYLEQELGKGSYGVVYKTVKISDGNFYAAKMMNKADIKDPKLLERLEEMIEKEVSVLKKLQHPNIVILEDVMITKNNIYLIFEFCDGGSLEGYLKKKKIIEEEEAIEFMKQLVEGMDYCISQKVIHRDIKPANILIHSSNKYNSGKLLKICDFGFGRFVQDINQQSSMTFQVGSPLYLDPEVYFENDYGYKCDIWSLGIIFYEMLHGRTPWDGDSAADLFNNNIINKPLVFDEHIRKDFKNLIRRMLQIQQEDRISIIELKKEIEKL